MSVESTYLLQTVLNVSVAILGIAVALVLVSVPGRSPLRWAVALVVALQAGSQFNALRYLESPRLPFGPGDPWFLWYNDMGAFTRLAMIGLFAFFPTRVRWRSLRGALLLAIGAVTLAGALGWFFAKPLLWTGWPAEGPGLWWNVFGRLLFVDGPLVGVLLLIVAAIAETRGRPAQERRNLAFLAVAIFPFFFNNLGISLIELTRDVATTGDPFATRSFLRGLSGDCCSISLGLWGATFAGAAVLAAFLWRETRSIAALALVGSGFVTFSLVHVAPFGWGFYELNVIAMAIMVTVAAQRLRVFGPFRASGALSLALALLAAACTFLVVNAYTLSFDHQIVLASGIFAGTILGAGAAVAMLPPGQLLLPWASASDTDRGLAAYRSAVQVELAAGLAGAALAEKLRPLRAELGLSDRDHAVLEHALAASATGGRSGVALRAGDVLLARYRIQRLLGQGGGGQVYLAQDEKLGRAVALKRLTQDETRDRAALERFQKETRLASALQHPHVVAVHDIEVVGNEAYIVMEYVPGGNLEERLRERPLAEEDARRIALDILAALDALHAQGIVHRDVKPSNVLLDAQGRGKLSDFSVARTVVSGETVGITGGSAAPVGTPAYMAPEQARGLPATPRSDLYSLGATLYAALCGRAPVSLHGLSEFEARIRVASEAPRLPLAGVSARMNAVLARALAKDPSERYQAAAAMRAELE